MAATVTVTFSCDGEECGCEEDHSIPLHLLATIGCPEKWTQKERHPALLFCPQCSDRTTMPEAPQSKP
jgi:hypothetical protein